MTLNGAGVQSKRANFTVDQVFCCPALGKSCCDGATGGSVVHEETLREVLGAHLDVKT